MKNKFIEVPFLPKGKVMNGLIDCKAGNEIIQYFNEKGIHVIRTIPCSELYEAVSSHPDMVLHPLGGNQVVIAPNVYSYYAPKLALLGFEAIKGATFLQRHYPSNIAYNVGRVGKYVIHNFQYTDEVLMGFLNKMNLIKIHVRQGYAKCSIAIVNEKAIITSDPGIHKEVLKYGLDSLLIEPGKIVLPGLDTGLIGGTCGYIDNKRLGFFGNLKKHKNYMDIKNFLEKYNRQLVMLSYRKLQDFGTFIPLLELDSFQFYVS